MTTRPLLLSALTLALVALPSLTGCSSGGEGEAIPADDEAMEELRAPKTFKCGDDEACNRKTEYCLVTSGPGTRPPPGQPFHSFTTHKCVDLPSSCGPKPTCACLGSGHCSGKASTGLTRAVLMM